MAKEQKQDQRMPVTVSSLDTISDVGSVSSEAQLVPCALTRSSGVEQTRVGSVRFDDDLFPEPTKRSDDMDESDDATWESDEAVEDTPEESPESFALNLLQDLESFFQDSRVPSSLLMAFGRHLQMILQRTFGQEHGSCSVPQDGVSRLTSPVSSVPTTMAQPTVLSGQSVQPIMAQVASVPSNVGAQVPSSCSTQVQHVSKRSCVFVLSSKPKQELQAA